MPVHINVQLFGWCSLPLVAFLCKVYGADREPAARWCRPALWIWSAALGVGALSWLSGHSSGKLFLDWTGYSRIVFPFSMLFLWGVLAFSFIRARSANIAKIAGLVLLLAVPVLIYIASGPAVYPPINPDSGGPTGASQLESTLVIVAILLLLPFGLTKLNSPRSWTVSASWAILGVEILFCFALGRADVSHHRPGQYLSLASLLVWLPLAPAYYAAFQWHANSRRWRIAFLCWWVLLVPTGWCLFLPGVLEHFKFTDGLVGHSLLAMAGFASSLLIFVMVQLLGGDAWIFNRPWSFWIWHASVLAYASLMFYAGWREGSDPAFTLIPSTARNSIYAFRLFLGVLMLIASSEWLILASQLPRRLPA
jgi:cytochrome c oxidase cbb3-type subunit 1